MSAQSAIFVGLPMMRKSAGFLSVERPGGQRQLRRARGQRAVGRAAAVGCDTDAVARREICAASAFQSCAAAATSNVADLRAGFAQFRPAIGNARAAARALPAVARRERARLRRRP